MTGWPNATYVGKREEEPMWQGEERGGKAQLIW